MDIQTTENIVALNATHINDLIRLSDLVEWDYDHHEITTILQSGRVFGIFDKNETVIACAAIITYDTKKLSSIGMVIVDPAHQGKGLGKQIVAACIASRVDKQAPLLLISTEMGEGLYKKMGFKEVASISTFKHRNIENAAITERTNFDIIPFKMKYFDEIVSLDAEAFGDCRRTFLENRLHQSEKCVVLRVDGIIKGYGMIVSTPDNLNLGPIVSSNTKGAIAIANELLRGFQGAVRVDMPKQDKDFVQFLIEKGFKETAPSPYMAYQSEKLPERNTDLFTLAAQVFG